MLAWLPVRLWHPILAVAEVTPAAGPRAAINTGLAEPTGWVTRHEPLPRHDLHETHHAGMNKQTELGGAMLLSPLDAVDRMPLYPVSQTAH